MSNRKAIKRRYTRENTQTGTQVTINIHIKFAKKNPLPHPGFCAESRGNYLHFNRWVELFIQSHARLLDELVQLELFSHQRAYVSVLVNKIN